MFFFILVLANFMFSLFKKMLVSKTFVFYALFCMYQVCLGKMEPDYKDGEKKSQGKEGMMEASARLPSIFPQYVYFSGCYFQG